MLLHRYLKCHYSYLGYFIASKLASIVVNVNDANGGAGLAEVVVSISGNGGGNLSEVVVIISANRGSNRR